ncbi:MAG: hypothetical protein FWH05_08765 [Oscillospiraceae bacterium]|nr:hypothetical protein [Oscillospiraceae bacterium]
MESPFKKMGSLQRLFTTFMEKVGEPLFLPIFGKAIDGVTGLLKNAIDWAEKNKNLLENWGQNAANWLDDGMSKLSEFASKIKGIVDSVEFKEANLFGKVKILWDEIIAKPFDEWWSGEGKAWVLNAAHKIGKGISSGIVAMFSGLFGVEMQGAIGDIGAIGTSFGKGFSQGFDGEKFSQILAKAFETAIKFVFSNPITGTIATAWFGSKLLGGISGALNLGKGVKSITEIGATGASKMALGAAGTAGAITVAVGLVDATSSLVISLNATNEEEKSAYGKDAAWKFGGMAAGAAAGAAIGTVVPVIGTVIGGLVGGAIGYFGGNVMGEQEIRKYEEEMQRAQEEAKKFRIQQEQSRYSSSKLQQAVKDLAEGSITSAEFMATKQAVITENLAKRFGAVKLSYVENRQYEITLGTKLLLPDMNMSGLNSVFDEIQQEINSLNDKLKIAVSVDEPDWEHIGDLRAKVAEQVSKITAAEYDTELLFLQKEDGSKIQQHLKDGNMDLALETFDELVAKLATLGQTAADNFNNSFKEGVFGLQLELNEGKISQAAFDEQFKNLETAYESNMAEFAERQTRFLANEIGHNFGLSAEDITSGMQESIQNGFNPATWTSLQVEDFLGIKSLEDGAGTQLAQMINRLGTSIPSMWNNTGNAEDYAKRKVWYTTKGYTMFGAGSEYKDHFERDGVRLYDPKPYANGGILGGHELKPIGNYSDSHGVIGAPHIGLVGEAGPEAIIPLSSNRRQRGVSLWERAGQMLGVVPHANGGIFGKTQNENTPLIPLQSTVGDTVNTIPVSVGDINFEVNIDSTSAFDSERIVQILKDNIGNLTDEIASNIALAIQKVYANLPTAAEGVY